MSHSWKLYEKHGQRCDERRVDAARGDLRHARRWPVGSLVSLRWPARQRQNARCDHVHRHDAVRRRRANRHVADRAGCRGRTRSKTYGTTRTRSSTGPWLSPVIEPMRRALIWRPSPRSTRASRSSVTAQTIHRLRDALPPGVTLYNPEAMMALVGIEQLLLTDRDASRPMSDAELARQSPPHRGCAHRRERGRQQSSWSPPRNSGWGSDQGAVDLNPQ